MHDHHEDHEHIHDHEHAHEHEHNHEHTHEHTHADGVTHTHSHEHTHTHEHQHDHGEGKPMEELVALMTYMSNHNAAHTQELEELAHEVQHAGKTAAFDAIMEAVRFFNQGNDALDRALDMMKE